MARQLHDMASRSVESMIATQRCGIYPPDAPGAVCPQAYLMWRRSGRTLCCVAAYAAQQGGNRKNGEDASLV